MTLTTKFLYLISGLIGGLSIASLIGFILKTKVKTPRAQAIVANLNARTNAWWGMVAILSIAFIFGRASTIILFCGMSFFALREFVTLTPSKPGDRIALFLSFFVIIPFQYYLIWIKWYGLFAIFIPVYAFLILPSLTVLAQDSENFLERVSKIQWGLMITVFCISHAPALLMLEISGYEGQDSLLLFFLMMISQLSDVLQYVFGTLFGKTKVAPEVSPNKTVEGLVGGALCTTLIGAGMWWITPFTPLQSAGIAYLIVLMGFLGGLVMSAIKRGLGTKDWGTMIRGHGGMLDRLDSVCFAAPIFFYVVRYFFV